MIISVASGKGGTGKTTVVGQYGAGTWRQTWNYWTATSKSPMPTFFYNQ